MMAVSVSPWHLMSNGIDDDNNDVATCNLFSRLASVSLEWNRTSNWQHLIVPNRDVPSVTLLELEQDIIVPYLSSSLICRCRQFISSGFLFVCKNLSQNTRRSFANSPASSDVIAGFCSRRLKKCTVTPSQSHLLQPVWLTKTATLVVTLVSNLAVTSYMKMASWAMCVMSFYCRAKSNIFVLSCVLSISFDILVICSMTILWQTDTLKLFYFDLWNFHYLNVDS